MTLHEIVAAYQMRKGRCLHRCEDQEAYFARLPGIGVAIYRAAHSLTQANRRHSHQRRIPLKVLKEAEERLRTVQAKLERSSDFAELYGIVQDAIASVRGVGPLTVYDVAVRIGLFLKITPQRVYVHAGAASGARALGLDCREGTSIDPGKFPEPLRQIPPADIENLLCIYKNELKSAMDDMLRAGLR
ncbi:hypothetical protein [Methylorubrum aminovorans]